MTVVDLRPMSDRLIGLIAKGDWEAANRQAAQLRELVGEICRHTAKMAMETRESCGEGANG